MELCAFPADIVEIKHIMLPPSPREFKDIYVVFELMETDLHQVRVEPIPEPCTRPCHGLKFEFFSHIRRSYGHHMQVMCLRTLAGHQGQ